MNFLKINSKGILQATTENDGLIFFIEHIDGEKCRIKLYSGGHHLNETYLHCDCFGDKYVSIRYQPNDEHCHFWLELQEDESVRIRTVSGYLHPDCDNQLCTKYQIDGNITTFRIGMFNNGSEIIMAKKKKKMLIIKSLWWPFGSHMNHIMWSKIYAKMRNMAYYYKESTACVFEKGLEYYYHDLCDSEMTDDYNFYDDYAHNVCIGQVSAKYKPEGYETVQEYHSSLIKDIMRPSERVQRFLDENDFLKEVRRLDGQYFGLHVRWGDKIAGYNKETTMIPLYAYMMKCAELRKKHNINKIVICSDTIDAIEELKKNNPFEFELIYNEKIHRPKNKWEDSLVQRDKRGETKFEEMAEEYMNCFMVYTILFESFAIVGNFDSAMCMIPAKARNRPDLDFSVTVKPGMWDICGGGCFPTI